ncbi:MAG TPA: hypothetical protein DCR21_03110, partial [Succinivibrionaceae bacterium]|nr:hypothetical protein [Succinivibrionaceae bacterium]
KEIRSVISSLKPDDRVRYDYDLLESHYIDSQNCEVDDAAALDTLGSEIRNREVLLVAPGKSSVDCKDKISAYIAANHPVVIGINAILKGYAYDYLFLMSRVRYDYAKEAYPEIFKSLKKILLSNVKTDALKDELIVRYERAIKRGWEHFDNAVICILRLLDKLGVSNVTVAGFDAFSEKYNQSYGDPKLPTIHGVEDWDKLNNEIREIFLDIKQRTRGRMKISFLTESYFSGKSDSE